MMKDKRLKRKLDIEVTKKAINRDDINLNARRDVICEFDAKIDEELNRRVEAVKHLREAGNLMRGLKRYNRRLGVHIGDAAVLADFIEDDVKKLIRDWPHEPEDLRDDWPHAKPRLLGAAGFRSGCNMYADSTTQYYTFNLNEPISNSTRS